VDEWLNKPLSFYTVEHYSAIERDELLLHAMPWINLQKKKNKNKNMLGEKKANPEKLHSIEFHGYYILKMTKIIEIENIRTYLVELGLRRLAGMLILYRISMCLLPFPSLLDDCGTRYIPLANKL
jgi:hypothetical protein